MRATFSPELPTVVLTLVPLILITSALQAGLLEHRRKWIDSDQALRSRRLWRSLLIGFSMLLMSVAAEAMALAELMSAGTALDFSWPMFICSGAVSFSLGVALARVIGDTLYVASSRRSERRAATADDTSAVVDGGVSRRPCEKR